MYLSIKVLWCIHVTVTTYTWCIETKKMSNKRGGGVKIDSNVLPFCSADSEPEEISVTVLKKRAKGRTLLKLEIPFIKVVVDVLRFRKDYLLLPNY